MCPRAVSIICPKALLPISDFARQLSITDGTSLQILLKHFRLLLLRHRRHLTRHHDLNRGAEPGIAQHTDSLVQRLGRHVLPVDREQPVAPLQAAVRDRRPLRQNVLDVDGTELALRAVVPGGQLEAEALRPLGQLHRDLSS